MPKVQRIKNSLAITIPSQIVRIKNWNKGDELYLTLDDRTGKVMMEKVITNGV